MSPRTSANHPSEPRDRTCARCGYCVWVIGVAGGYHCTHPANAVGGRPCRLPSGSHGCEHYTATTGDRTVRS